MGPYLNIIVTVSDGQTFQVVGKLENHLRA